MLQDQPERRVLLGLQVQLELQDQLVQLELQDQPELQELQVPQVQLE